MDLAHAYIPLEDESVTDNNKGLYQGYNILPFGISSAPAILVDNGNKEIFPFVYIDV